MRRLLALAFLVALVFPAGAAAHATLERTSPAFGTRVEQSPKVVRLSFDQSVDALPNAIKVYSAHGALLSGVTRMSADTRTIAAPVKTLRRGGYTVRWRAVSADGHVVNGVFTFGVKMPAPAATDAFGSGGIPPSTGGCSLMRPSSQIAPVSQT
ncbi:MAG: copper resistance CopC family protein [Conexibacter sp.]